MTFEQGDIVALDFPPTEGREQGGCRTALVVSRNLYNEKTGFVVVCPITNRERGYPSRVALDGRTKTTGFVICEQLRSIDARARNPSRVEKLPEELLRRVVEIVTSIFENTDYN